MENFEICYTNIKFYISRNNYKFKRRKESLTKYCLVFLHRVSITFNLSATPGRSSNENALITKSYLACIKNKEI